VTHSMHRTTWFLSVVFVALLLATATVWSASPQEKHAPQTAGVDDTKMGPYRALAQVIFSASQKGDPATAAQLARVLELLWDKAEDYGGDTALSKTNHKLFDEIDKAMDQFVTPLKDYKNKTPDAAKVKAAYNTYLEKLRLAD
jgi:preprotein translocase subunit SecG